MSAETVFIVVDTSVIAKWLIADSEDDIEQATALLEAVEQETVQLLAPELSKYEIGNILIKGKQLPAPQAAVILETFYYLPITFISETNESAHLTLELAAQHTLTYYDASFLSLAQKYQCPFITADKKLQKSLQSEKVILLSEYT